MRAADDGVSRFTRVTTMSTTREARTVDERRDRTDAADRRRFVLALVGFAVLFAVLGRTHGEDIALMLQKTPTTEHGWRFVGWLVVAPPALLVLITWHERRRLTARQRRDRGGLLAGWVGVSAPLAPARGVRGGHPVRT